VAKWIFLSLLILATAYVARAGGREERLALATLFSAYVATYAIMEAQGEDDWLDPPVWVALADLASFAVLVAIAIRSKRFWPMPVAALQLLPALTPIVVILGENLASYPIGVSQGVWSYLQLAILILAAARHQRRRKRVRGTPAY
jgi:hypothetical protein